MLTYYYESQQFIEKLQNGPAGSYIEGFAEQLRKAGYARLSARRYIRAAEHLMFWVHRKHVALPFLQDSHIDSFIRHLPQCRCYAFGHSDRPNLRSGARLFLKYLQCIGACSCDNNKPTPPPLLDAFREWMKVQRNISEATLYNYGLAVSKLLQRLGEDPSNYDAQGLRGFVLEQSRHCGRAKAKTVVTALRAFIRFLIAEGKCPVGLDEAIPTLAHWHLSTLPRYLQAEEVERVIQACDPNTPAGIRDRAIVLLLARLGLRASDIVHLHLGDINWREAWIRVSGKGRRETQLPLSQELGDAILAYLTQVRPEADTDTLFIRSRAPLRGFGSHSAVSVIVAKALRKAGISSPARGAAHLLRHSAATAMLRQGASLQEIAAVLRHRCIETSTIYAKVDGALLKQVAQPWPEIGQC